MVKKANRRNTLLSVGAETLKELDWLVESTEIDASTRTEIMRRLIRLAYRRKDIRESLHGGTAETSR